VVGYEANGGFLTASPVRLGDGELRALPTRDAVIVILAVLVSAAQRGVPVSGLLAELPPRFTASDRLRDFPAAAGAALLENLSRGSESENRDAFARALAPALGGGAGAVAALDRTDGLRATLGSGEIVHLRPSGNAPEFRCYTEADSEDRAVALARGCLAVIAAWREGL
jgi:phosphomannomutase